MVQSSLFDVDIDVDMDVGIYRDYNQFPEEIWTLIFEFFDIPTMKNSALVCRCWYMISNMEVIWELYCKNKYIPRNAKAALMQKPESWREYFVTKTLMEKPGIMKWETVKPLTVPLHGRYRHTTNTLGDKVVLIGGQFNTEDIESDTLYAFNPAKLDFRKINIENLPTNLSRHSSVVYNSKVFVFGGRYKLNQKSNRVYCFDPELGQWNEVHTTGIQPEPRTDHAACLVGNKMYVFWGSSSRLCPIEDIHTLNLDTGEWECFQSKNEGPKTRSGHTATAIGKNIFVFGGGQWFGKSSDWDVKFNDIHVLNTETNQWILNVGANPSPSVSTFVASFSIDRFIFYVGGSSSTGPYVTADTHYFDTVSMTWVSPKVEGDFGKRDSASVCLFGHKAILIDGYAGGAQNKIVELRLDWSQMLEKYRLAHAEVNVPTQMIF